MYTFNEFFKQLNTFAVTLCEALTTSQVLLRICYFTVDYQINLEIVLRTIVKVIFSVTSGDGRARKKHFAKTIQSNNFPDLWLCGGSLSYISQNKTCITYRVSLLNNGCLPIF